MVIVTRLVAFYSRVGFVYVYEYIRHCSLPAAWKNRIYSG